MALAPPKKTSLLKNRLESYLLDMDAEQFIAADPIQFPHRYCALGPKTQELVAFITAMVSYGNRKAILQTVEQLLSALGPTPLEQLTEFPEAIDRDAISRLIYRFQKGPDFLWLLDNLSVIYQRYGSLEACFIKAQPQHHRPNLTPIDYQQALARFMETLRVVPATTYGQQYLIPDPAKGGACKRLHMFMRWVVRPAEACPGIDLGLWQVALSPTSLLMPLDTHVSQMARKLKLTTRKSDDWHTMVDITHRLKRLDPHDPIKYDFALFGAGVASHTL